MCVLTKRNLGLLVLLGLLVHQYGMAMTSSKEVRRGKRAVKVKMIAADDPNHDFKYCPYPNELKKKGQYWYADGAWKSYSESFVDHIERFIGAQWQGVQVGRMVCVYAGSNAQAFPVTIQRANLVFTPRIEGWTRKEYNAYACHGQHVKKCPYLLAGEEKEIKSEEELREVFRDIKQ